MKTIRTANSLRNQLKDWKQKGEEISFIPTMGALHEGHLSLCEAAKKKGGRLVCSIFVNPKQFNKKADFDNYPISIEQDIELLNSVNCDLVFIPSVKEVFPKEFNSELPIDEFDKSMEGEYRPGHFKGMATVVEAFFRLIQPDRAYFGQKDFQQLLIVQKLSKYYQLGIEVIGVPTARAKDGLALSSRNRRLSEEQLKKAATIFKALNFCRENKNHFKPKELRKRAIALLHDSIELEYFDIVEEQGLIEVEDWEKNSSYRALFAGNLAGVRLIDNLSLID